jgi:hypothetical protein
MIKSKLNNTQSNYAIVDEDFVYAQSRPGLSRPQSSGRGSAGFNKSSGRKRSIANRYTINMVFKPYINLYEAIIDGIDEVEVVITERDKFTLDYFSAEQTPANVANDINSFFTKAKQKLKIEAEKLEIYSEEFNLTDFVRDKHVAYMGNGRINKKNYWMYLPKKDVLSVANFRDAQAALENPMDTITTDAVHTGSLNDDRDARDLAFDTFDSAGYDPAMIAQVRYPSTGKKARSNGIRNSRINPPDQTIPQFGSKRAKAPAIFYELHKKFFKSTASESTRYSIVETPQRLKYIRVNFKLGFEVDESTYQKLALKNRLFFMLKFKKNNITVKTEKFSFNSRKEFSKGQTRYRPLDLRCKAGDPQIAESDKITVTNRNRFVMNFTIYETSVREGEIVSRKIKSGQIRPKTTEMFEQISTIFGSASQSRSYRIMSCRRGAKYLCNIDEVVTPATTKKPSYESQFPAIYATKSTANSAVINVKNPPVDADLIKIIRKDLGPTRPSSSPRGRKGAGLTTVGKALPLGSSRKFIVAVLDSASSILDNNRLFHNSIYEYSAEFYFNGAKLPAEVSTILHYMDDSSISSKISFNTSEKSSTRTAGSIVHSFKIEETISKDTADKLLSTINAQGQQSTYSEELTEIKNQTGTITKYRITRQNLRTGSEEVVSNDALPNIVQTFNITKSRRDSYKYIIQLDAAPAAAVSYSSVVESIDQSSGQSFKYSYRKWRGQKTYDDEALPSVSAIVKNNFAEAMNKSGKKATITFSGPATVPKIQIFTAGRDSFNKCNWLEWSIRGSTDNIDHFLILCFYDGIQAPIGAAGIPPGQNRTFIYKDTRMYGLLGDVIYQVVIVSKDFTYYTNSPEKSVRYNSTINPRTFMKGKG